jgi:hypothetical protein
LIFHYQTINYYEGGGHPQELLVVKFLIHLYLASLPKILPKCLRLDIYIEEATNRMSYISHRREFVLGLELKVAQKFNLKQNKVKKFFM